MQHYFVTGVIMTTPILVWLAYVSIRMVRGTYRMAVKGAKGLLKGALMVSLLVGFMMLFVIDVVCMIGMAVLR